MEKSTLNLTPMVFLRYSFVLMLIFLLSCHRQDSFLKPAPINMAQAKEWLNKNGLSYKNETIHVNDILKGKLNWEKSSQYQWEGKNYIDIPYEFDGQSYIGDKNGGKTSTFNLVIRKNFDGNYEGALRSATYGISISNEDDQNEVLQTYELIDGTKANIWYSDFHYKNPKPLKNETITKEQFLQIKTNQTSINRSVNGNDCNYVPVETYTNCNYSMGDTVVVLLCRQVTYLKICSDAPPTNVPGNTFPPIGVGSSPSGSRPPISTLSNDPCANAAIAITKLNNAFQTIGLYNSIQKFANVATEAYEQGFLIIERRIYDSQDNTKFTSNYYTFPIEKSTSTNIINHN